MDDFTDDQVDAAIDYVIANGAQDRGQTVAYYRVFEVADLPSPQVLHSGGESHLVTKFMARFHHRCKERQLPPLDALVVHVAGPRPGSPGAGYFRVNGQRDPFVERTTPEQQIQGYNFWQEQIRECRAWGEHSRRGRP
jgi:hypothetical protein